MGCKEQKTGMQMVGSIHCIGHLLAKCIYWITGTWLYFIWDSVPYLQGYRL